MQNATSPSYSSYLAPHFELKSRRFSCLKLVFRCELRLKKTRKFPDGRALRHVSLQPLYVSARYRVLHNCAAPPPNAKHDPRNLGSPEETT